MKYLTYEVSYDGKKLSIKSPINNCWYSLWGPQLQYRKQANKEINSICKMVNFYGNKLNLSIKYIQIFSKYARREKTNV